MSDKRQKNTKPAVLFGEKCVKRIGYIDGYLASYNLRQSASFCAIVTAIMVCIGVALALVLPLLNLGNLVNVATVLALHAVNYIFLYIANLFYRF